LLGLRRNMQGAVIEISLDFGQRIAMPYLGTTCAVQDTYGFCSLNLQMLLQMVEPWPRGIVVGLHGGGALRCDTRVHSM
jgi:hypothetical protein